MTDHRSPMIASSTIIGIIGYALAPVWVAPAIYYNLDWHHGSPWSNTCAVIFILAAALCFLTIHWVPRASIVAMAMILGLGLTVNNSWNALENISTIDNRLIDDRKAKIEGSGLRSSDRREWSAIIENAKTRTGSRSPADLQSEVDSYVSANARNWQKTSGCDPMETTKSAAFCAEVNRLKGLVAIAADRDQKQAWIRDLDRQAAAAGAKPTNADDMASAVAVLLGVQATPETLASIRAWRGLTKTFWLEAQAAIMPAIWIAIVDALLALIRGTIRLATAAAARAQQARSKPEKPVVQAGTEVPRAEKPKGRVSPEFARFAADELEVGGSYSIKPTPCFALWQTWCKPRGIEPGSQKAFGVMMTEAGKESGWHRDPAGGYPTYVGVRQRDKAAKLRVVS